MSGATGATTVEYPAEGQYGHKKADVEAVARHIPPGTTTLAEPFGGTGVFAHHVKGLGVCVMTNDVMAFAHLRLKTFVENDHVVLREEDIAAVTAPNPCRGRTIEEWYGAALGRGNAEFLDGLAANLRLLDAGMKRDVAVCLAVLCVMRRMGYCSASFGVDGGFTGRRSIRKANLSADFRKMALEEFPRLLRTARDAGTPCVASRGDAIAFVARAKCEVVYMDPPFPSPGGRYERDLAFYDKLVHALQGHPELVEHPHNGPVGLPPHTDFASRKPAIMGIKLLFRAARDARRVILSFNSTSAVRPSEIITAARDCYGGLVAYESTPGRRPTSSSRGRKTTDNVLMVFDRGRPAAATVPDPGDITFADLFAGVGGFRAALQGAGCRCVFSSEIEKNARATYLANWGELPAGDIAAIRAEEVPEHDILCGGFPCQCFSIAGKKAGFADATRGTLFFEIVRILQARQPRVAFLENVRNLVSHDGARTLEVIRKTLADCGYTVFWQVLNASLYGAPTSRKRVYIVAFRSDLVVTEFVFPEPTFEPVKLADMLLPDSETDAYVVRNHPIHIDQKAVATADAHAGLTTVPVGRIGYRMPAKQGYRVYSPIGHAVTFLSRGGGVGAQTGLYWINGRVRKLAAREMARVMGYPESFVIPSSLTYEQARRLFGNSIVVPVVRRIFDRVAATLGEASRSAPGQRVAS